MTMPLRPVRVAGGLRFWIATFFTDCDSESSARCRRGLPAPGGSRPADALMASVIESPVSATSLSCAICVVACPERFVERGDLFGCRAILLGLRDAAARLQSLAESCQLAQPLRCDLELEAVRCARALLDGGIAHLPVRHCVENDDRLVARLRQVDEVR